MLFIYLFISPFSSINPKPKPKKIYRVRDLIKMPPLGPIKSCQFCTQNPFYRFHIQCIFSDTQKVQTPVSHYSINTCKRCVHKLLAGFESLLLLLPNPPHCPRKDLESVSYWVFVFFFFYNEIPCGPTHHNNTIDKIDESL